MFDTAGIFVEDAFLEKSMYNSFLAKLACLNAISDEKLRILPKEETIHFRSMISPQEPTFLTDTDAPSGPCLPGHLRLFVNCNGFFYPCERVSELCRCAQIGSIDTGFDYKNVYDFLNIAQLTEKECKKCWAIKGCNICGRVMDIRNEDSTGCFSFSYLPHENINEVLEHSLNSELIYDLLNRASQKKFYLELKKIFDNNNEII